LIPTQIIGIKAKQISTGSNYTVLIDLESNVWLFGFTENAALNIIKITQPLLIKNFKAYQVSAGYNYTMMIATSV